MTLFSVWAPHPRMVELEVDGRRLAMERHRGGWWRAEVPEAGPGARYGFRLDGGPLRPDPRSRWQPDGIDGPSALVDAHFDWSDGHWRGLALPGAVLYELHIGTFTPQGTFAAAIDKLPQLVDLGVDAVEIMPVAEFSGRRGWGYDGVDLFAPHHGYGGPDGLRALIDACHGHNLGVVIDVVYNHLGPAGNYLPEFGPYFSERHHTNWGAAINYDGPGSDAVRRFVIDNALMWLGDYHTDGLRLDAVHAIVDDSARHLLEEMSEEVSALAARVGRPLFLIAESDLNDPRFVQPASVGGYGMQAAWADEWHHALHAALTGERSGYYEDFGSLALLAKALRQAWVYDGTWSEHRHRHHGRSPAGLWGHHFVVCTQNHDQVGNRAAGERSSALMSPGRLKVAAALLLTGPFTPMLFQGEEWAATSPFLYFTDHPDTELGKAVTEGRRREFSAFGWDPADVPDPQDPATYTRSQLDWAERESEGHRQMLDWYRFLIRLRRRYPELADPRLSSVSVRLEEDTGSLEVSRGSVRVLVNLGRHPLTFPRHPGEALLGSSEQAAAPDGGWTVSPDAVVLVAPAVGAPGAGG